MDREFLFGTVQEDINSIKVNGKMIYSMVKEFYNLMIENSKEDLKKDLHMDYLKYLIRMIMIINYKNILMVKI
jgi:hypothetical protein